MTRSLKMQAPRSREDTAGRPRIGELRALRAELEDLRCRVAWLETELDRRHPPWCPRCREGPLEVVGRRPHPEFGFADVEEHTMRCTGCGHTEARLHDPRHYLR